MKILCLHVPPLEVESTAIHILTVEFEHLAILTRIKQYFSLFSFSETKGISLKQSSCRDRLASKGSTMAAGQTEWQLTVNVMF